MPLLLNGKQQNTDAWVLLNDDQELPDNQAHVVVSLQRFLAQAENGEPIPAGVRIAPSDNVTPLAAFVDQLRLICIDIPVYTDGRGYSHARLLRKRFGYKAELRAVGDVRADQILFLQRLGFNAFDCITSPDQTLLQQLVTRFEHNYQPSYPLPVTAPVRA